MKIIIRFLFVLIACMGMGILHGFDYESLSPQELTILAKNNDAEAQCKLGKKYSMGMGVRQDDEKALRWWRLAAEHGNAEAMYNLGMMYYIGAGSEHSIEQARNWWLRAAEHGSADAQCELAILYTDPRYIEYDTDEGNKWSQMAEENDAMVAAVYWGNLCSFKWNFDDAHYWYLLAAEQGSAEAQSSLGELYFEGMFEGMGVEKDIEEALKWTLSAANQGYVYAQHRLGKLYFSGEDVEKDYEEASKWWLLAAERGYSSAMYNLGRMSQYGEGVQDLEKAYFWYLLYDACVGHLYSSTDNLDDVAAELSPAQRTKVKKEAREWAHEKGFILNI